MGGSRTPICLLLFLVGPEELQHRLAELWRRERGPVIPLLDYRNTGLRQRLLRCRDDVLQELSLATAVDELDGHLVRLQFRLGHLPALLPPQDRGQRLLVLLTKEQFTKRSSLFRGGLLRAVRGQCEDERADPLSLLQ